MKQNVKQLVEQIKRESHYYIVIDSSNNIGEGLTVRLAMRAYLINYGHLNTSIHCGIYIVKDKPDSIDFEVLPSGAVLLSYITDNVTAKVVV